MSPWLAVVGIGEDGLSGLSAAARALVESAEFLVGGTRHLAMVPEASAGSPLGPRTWDSPLQRRMDWPNPFSIEPILALRGRRVCVLATGDPMHFGVGATLARAVAIEEMTVIPSPSAFALAAARLGWALEGVAALSVHGRPMERIATHIRPGARLLILAHDEATPARIAVALAARGFGASRITALSHMGGAREARVSALAAEWDGAVAAFHTLAVDCVAGPEAVWHPRTGLPDDAYEHDGKLTKREFRALALSKLMPTPGALLWDVGAGCGSVGIEWLRAEDSARAIGLEPDPARRAMAARNAAALGAPHLNLREARAPEGLAGLAAPDAVFLGGGMSEPAIAAALDRLKPEGRLVAHAVTLESEALLLAAYARHGGELIRLSVARAEPVGPYSGWRPGMPVTQWAWRKA